MYKLVGGYYHKFKNYFPHVSKDHTEVMSTEKNISIAETVRSMAGDALPVIPLPEGRLDELFRLQRLLAEVQTPKYAAFGEDEFIGVEGFRALIDSGDTLVVIDDGAIDSFVCVAPSVHARYYNAAIADLFVGVNSTQAKAGVFRKWVDVASAHARSVGYVTVLVQTFVTNVSAFGDLRDAGFEFCAVLPSSGQVRGLGLTDCVLWMKYIANRNVSLKHSRAYNAYSMVV